MGKQRNYIISVKENSPYLSDTSCINKDRTIIIFERILLISDDVSTAHSTLSK